MPLRAIKGKSYDKIALLPTMFHANLSGQLFGSNTQCVTDLIKYEPLWLGDYDTSEVEVTDSDEPMSKASWLTGGRLRVGHDYP